MPIFGDTSRPLDKGYNLKNIQLLAGDWCVSCRTLLFSLASDSRVLAWAGQRAFA